MLPIVGVLAVACCGGALMLVRRSRSRRAAEVLQGSAASVGGGDGEATGSTRDAGQRADAPVLAVRPTMPVLDVVRPFSSRRTSTEQETSSSRKPSVVRMGWTSRRRECVSTGAQSVLSGGSARRRAEEPKLRLDSI